jgi:hypothetical protein
MQDIATGKCRRVPENWERFAALVPGRVNSCQRMFEWFGRTMKLPKTANGKS